VLWFVYDSGCISLFTDASVPLWHHRRVHAKCKQERTLNMTEQQQEAWIYTFERIALVQTILNGGAAALVAALKAEESYMHTNFPIVVRVDVAIAVRLIGSSEDVVKT